MKIFCLYILFFLSALGTQAQDWTLIGDFESGVGDMLGDKKSNRLYVVGAFDSINGKYTRGIAAWDGNQWNELDHGINYDSVPSTWGAGAGHISKYKGKLIVGGIFHSVGYFQKSRNVALWDPDSKKWETLDWNPDGSVDFVYDTNDTTYVFGTYDSIDGKHSPGANFLFNSKWNNMNPPQGALRVRTAFPFKGYLYCGGNMNTQIVGANDLARWDGKQFYGVGHGVDGTFGSVTDLDTFNNELYIAGYFLKSEGHTGEHIMKWDGTQFHNVGDANGYVSDLLVRDGILYASGFFTKIGGVEANQIAWYDGNHWHSLGSGNHTVINKMAFLNDTLFVQRDHEINTINNFQVLKFNKPLPISNGSIFGPNHSIAIFPNPATSNIRIQGLKRNDKVKIYNISGSLHYSGTSSYIDIESFSSGLYIVNIKSKAQQVNLKFLKQ